MSLNNDLRRHPVSVWPTLMGDGRQLINPTAHIPGTRPISVTRSQVRAQIARFLQTGRSNHSAMGQTLWVIVTYCQLAGLSYELSAVPNLGYELRRSA